MQINEICWPCHIVQRLFKHADMDTMKVMSLTCRSWRSISDYHFHRKGFIQYELTDNRNIPNLKAGRISLSEEQLEENEGIQMLLNVLDKSTPREFNSLRNTNIPFSRMCRLAINTIKAYFETITYIHTLALQSGRTPALK